MEEVGQEVKIVLFGDCQSGKTSMTVRFTNDEFIENYRTVGLITHSRVIELHGERKKLTVFELAGQSGYKALVKVYYKNAHVVLLVYNPLQSSSLEHIPYYFKNGKQLCQNALFVLVATHSDECGFSKEAGEQQAKELGIPFFATSAKTGENIDKLFLYIAREYNTLTKLNPLPLEGWQTSRECYCAVS